MEDKASEPHSALSSAEKMETLDLRSTELLRKLAEVLPRELGSINDKQSLHRMIDVLSTALVAVRTRCNLISTAHKLPPEILLFIFDLVRHESVPEEEQAAVPFTAASIRSLVAWTHVCHRWRTVALNSPTLWTGLVSGSPLAETFAQRAQECPLSLTMAVIRGQVSKPEKQLLWRLRPRIQRLHIILESLHQIQVFLKPLAALASGLEELSIMVRKRRTLPVLFQTAFPLFGGSAPRLKSLSICSPDPLFPSDSFPQMLTLHLSNFQHGIVIDSLSQLLRRTPSLETVHMHLRFPPGTHDNHLGVFSTGAPIRLPRIRRFCLASLPSSPWFHPPHAHGPDLCSIVSGIVFPPCAVVTIHQLESYTLALLGAPRLYMPPVGPNPTSTLTVDDRGTTITTRGHSTYSITYQDRLTACAIRGAYAVPPRFIGNQPLLSSLAVLRLQGAMTWRWPREEGSNSVLNRLIAFTPLLTELMIRDFAKEMLPQLTCLLEHAGAPMLCPLLTSVTFITLGSTVSSPDALEPERILDILLRATMRRAERSRPLARFTFCSPYVEQECTLHNSHGVEQVDVLCRDVWSERSEGVDRTAAAHREAIERSFPQQECARTRGYYETMWQKHVEGSALTGRRSFGAYGHRHKWP